MCTMYDSDYCGLAEEEPNPVLCKHRAVAAKFVCFEHTNTGRRFFGCSGPVCDLLHCFSFKFKQCRCCTLVSNLCTHLLYVGGG